MSKKKTLSPTLFLIIEFFILAPSVLFITSIFQVLFFRDYFLYSMVIAKGESVRNIFVTIITPFAGGFFAYQYLERYKPSGFIALKAKGIIFYSIMFVGLVISYQFLKNIW